MSWNGPRVEPLEVAYGFALEPLGSHVPSPRSGRAWGSPRQVLEDVVLESMVRGRTTVSFSGGRDSSLILAVACLVARREGLPLPTAVTMRHHSPSSQETEWQELVIEHLGVPDWVRFDAGDDLDMLGDTATAALRQVGLLCPPNAYLHLGMLRAAPCETLLTGMGGDEVFSPTTVRLAQVAWGGARPEPRDALRVLLAAAPRRVRRWRQAHTSPVSAPWLTAEARSVLSNLEADYYVAVRMRWDADALLWAGARATVMAQEGLSAVARMCGAEARSPLCDDRFVAAFAHAVGPLGPVDRSGAMRMLAADLLPEVVLSRSTKAAFGGVVWGPEFTRFVSQWRPETLDPVVAQFVDVPRLQKIWAESPHYGTMLLAQRAWLDQTGHAPA